jgi:hypothetical protein
VTLAQEVTSRLLEQTIGLPELHSQ